MKFFLALLVISSLSHANAFAGASNADLECKAPGGVSIQGSVPGDFAELYITVKANGKSSNLFSGILEPSGETEENVKFALVESQSDSVWVLSANRTDGNGGGIKIFALPKTFRTQKREFGYGAKFTAKGTIILPELGRQPIDAIFFCTLSYSI